MDFTQRNDAWTGAPRFFIQPNSSGAPRYWSVRVDGATTTVQYGTHGGALQTTSETFKGVNIGKANELSPEAYALSRTREKCRLKWREGYREVSSEGIPLDAAVPEAEKMANPLDLPQNLCFYKPDNSLSKRMDALARSGEALYLRKRDGYMFVLAKGRDDECPVLYSRRMLRQHEDEVHTDILWGDRFPGIIESARRLLPENSIVLGDICVDVAGKDDRGICGSMIKGLTDTSIQTQQHYAAYGVRPFLYIWGVALWGGRNMLETAPYREIVETIQLAFETCPSLRPVESATFPSPESAKAHALNEGWEGFVVVDPAGVIGDKGVTLKGKPDRPGSICGKLKPSHEDDFVGMWDPEQGVGKRSTKEQYSFGIGAVALHQYDAQGQLVFICNVASGLTREYRISRASPDQWPRVLKVAYTDRTYISDGDETNALTEPRFLEERTDKEVRECSNPKL